MMLLRHGHEGVSWYKAEMMPVRDDVAALVVGYTSAVRPVSDGEASHSLRRRWIIKPPRLYCHTTGIILPQRPPLMQNTSNAKNGSENRAGRWGYRWATRGVFVMHTALPAQEVSKRVFRGKPYECRWAHQFSCFTIFSCAANFAIGWTQPSLIQKRRIIQAGGSSKAAAGRSLAENKRLLSILAGRQRSQQRGIFPVVTPDVLIRGSQNRGEVNKQTTRETVNVASHECLVRQ